MVNRRITRNNLHLYLNPEREVDEGAAAVHGMTWDDLRDRGFSRIVVLPMYPQYSAATSASTVGWV